MSRITVVPSDGIMVVDGVGRRINLSSLDSNIHAIQWDSTTSRGRIEYKNHKLSGGDSGFITSFAPFNSLVAAWNVENARVLQQEEDARNRPPPVTALDKLITALKARGIITDEDLR